MWGLYPTTAADFSLDVRFYSFSRIFFQLTYYPALELGTNSEQQTTQSTPTTAHPSLAPHYSSNTVYVDYLTSGIPITSHHSGKCSHTYRTPPSSCILPELRPISGTSFHSLAFHVVELLFKDREQSMIVSPNQSRTKRTTLPQ